jgi:Transglycosylase SLT domain
MRKRLQLALMVSMLAATSFSFPAPLRAADDPDGSGQQITTADEHGRKIYVNDSVEKPREHGTQWSQTPRRALMYWSSKENRWKPVPPPSAAAMKAARSAAAEVSQSIGQQSRQSAAAKVVASDSGGEMAMPGDVDAAIEQAAARHNVDPNLVRAVVKVESNFNPNAVSRKGAMGLMQLMPATARQLKVNNPFDPQQNVDAGVRHLKQLLESYGGDVKLTLAAYNAGAGAVARSSGVPHYAETQSYVRRITSLYYSGSGYHGVSGFNPAASREPMTVQRDERGFLYISNTD